MGASTGVVYTTQEEFKFGSNAEDKLADYKVLNVKVVTTGSVLVEVEMEVGGDWIPHETDSDNVPISYETTGSYPLMVEGSVIRVTPSGDASYSWGK